MTPLDLALRYMALFYNDTGEVDQLREFCTRDLEFHGPFYAFDDLETYIASLKASPPVGLSYELLESFENANSACLVYRFSNGQIETTIAQTFSTRSGKIGRIQLIFDSAAFHPTNG